MKYGEMFDNPSFLRFALLLRTAEQPGWKKAHPFVDYWGKHRMLAEVLTEEYLKSDRKVILNRFLDLTWQLGAIYPRHGYQREDVEWLVSVVESPECIAVLWTLLAFASAKQKFFTPAEIAEVTGTSESHWRKKAAGNTFFGAFKKGKMWLIPASALRLEGVDMPAPKHSMDGDEDEQDEGEERVEEEFQEPPLPSDFPPPEEESFFDSE